MGQNTVPDFIGQKLRKTGDLSDLFIHHLHADDDMADELSFLRVIVAWEFGELFGLSYIVKKRHRDQKISFQERIIPAEEMAEIGDAQCVLRKSAHKAVVHTLRGGGHAEILYELFILHKELFEKCLQIFVLDTFNVFADRAHHIVNVLVGDRHIVRRIILSLMALSRSLDIELQVSLERDHIAGDIHIIKLIKVADPHAVGVPDLGVDGTCLVLQCQALVVLAVLGDQRHPFLAKIDILDAASFT